MLKMGIIKRQGLKSTVVTYIGMVIGYVNLLWILPLCLTTEQIGLTRVLVDAGFLFSYFAVLGMNGTIIKYFPKFYDVDKKHNGFHFLMLGVPLAGFLIFCFFFFLFKKPIIDYFSENSALLNQYAYLLIPFTFLLLFISLLDTYASALYRIVVPKILKEILLKIFISCICLLFYFKYYNFNIFILLFFLGYLLILFFQFIYTQKLEPFKIKPNFSFIDKDLKAEMITYSLYMILGGIGGVIVTKIDSIMLNHYQGLAAAGVYTTAFFIATVIEAPGRSLVQISQPVVSEALISNDIPKLNQLYKKTSILQFMAGCFIFLGIWMNIDNVFKIMPNGQEFAAGKYVILFVAFCKLIDALTSINMVILNTSKYFRVTFYFLILLAIMTIICNVIFIPMYGLLGAAFSAFITLSIYNFICVSYVYWKFKISPFSTGTIKVILITLLVYAIIYFIPTMGNPYSDLLLRSVFITLIFCGLAYFFKASEDVNLLVENSLSKIKSFRK